MYYLIMSATVETYLPLKLSANFCHELLVISRYTAGTHVSTVVASDFTSRSSDYILSKAGLFSTKLSLPELSYFIRYNQMNKNYTKSPFFISFSGNYAINFYACASG